MDAVVEELRSLKMSDPPVFYSKFNGSKYQLGRKKFLIWALAEGTHV